MLLPIRIFHLRHLWAITLLIITGSNLAVASPGKVTWNKYAEEGFFEIKIPQGYEITKTENENGLTIKINAKAGEMMYMLSYTLHNTPLLEQEQLEQVSLDAFAEAMETKNYVSETWKVGKERGLHCTMINPDQIKMSYAVIIKGQVQYQLISFAQKEQFDPKGATKFKKSLKLK